jgi:hypothetical protein
MVVGATSVLIAGICVTLWQIGGVTTGPSPDAAVIVTPDPDLITELIRAHGDAIYDQCYKPANIRLHGDVLLEFEVAADGHVRRVEIVGDDFRGTAIARCAAARALDWEFPPGTPAEVRVPLHFGPR